MISYFVSAESDKFLSLVRTNKQGTFYWTGHARSKERLSRFGSIGANIWFM